MNRCPSLRVLLRCKDGASVARGCGTIKDIMVSISDTIWHERYRAPADGSIGDTWKRVARHVASAELTPLRKHWEEAFCQALDDFKLLPGGRILAGAGTDRVTTLLNCFVMGALDPSPVGIASALRESGLTLASGGGIGCDFSPLGRGQVVAHLALWNSMSAASVAASARRGAMMATLSCDHPDIGEFVTAKRMGGSLEHFNLSVLVTDAFMAAVKAGDSGAVALWELIMHATYDAAEPGVLFVDRINRENNLWYAETITATNPCGEIPLPAYGACNLASINLTCFVSNPFTAVARFDLTGLAAIAATATRFLDDVLSVTEYPLRAQREVASRARRLGLGITGLGDALAMIGLDYRTETARAAAAQAMATICHSAYRASIELAREKGAFSAFDRARHLEGPFVRGLPEDICAGIATHGIRNSHLLAIAPAGTISLLAGNVSSGIEPIFALRQTRRVLGIGAAAVTHELVDAAVAAWERAHGAQPLPGAFVTAANVSPSEHVRMEAALQPFVDNAISKTVNVPADIPFEQFCDVYRLAYDLGAKGCTTFRPNSVTGSIFGDDCCIP